MLRCYVHGVRGSHNVAINLREQQPGSDQYARLDDILCVCLFKEAWKDWSAAQLTAKFNSSLQRTFFVHHVRKHGRNINNGALKDRKLRFEMEFEHCKHIKAQLLHVEGRTYALISKKLSLLGRLSSAEGF